MGLAATHPRLPRRDTDARLVGGVCAGLARAIGIDPIVVRLAFVAAATAGGFGILLYAVLWVVLPAGSGPAVAGTLPRPDRGAVEVAIGTGMLVGALVLGLREVGWWFSDLLVWPTVLAAAGGALLWRQAQAGATPRETPVTPAAVAADRAAVVSRTGVGVALVIAAALVFLQLTGALGAVRDAALGAITVAVVLSIVFAPLVVRQARSLAAERDARVRTQERAELGAHLHDSVLQTLALVQQRADDPRAVAALARRQERELRRWLAGRAGTAASRLGAALEAAASEIEADHDVEIEVVVAGDAELDDDGRALVAAAREAMLNAAKFGGGASIDVYAETTDGVRVFVRDRGPGFDPRTVGEDRRGVRESIVGRMTRHGGRAVVRSSPGAGTEVELELPA